MIVFLNRHAGGGIAAQRWDAVRRGLEATVLAPGYELVTRPTDLEPRLAAMPDGREVLVAAGGDGTVHLVLEMLMRLPEAQRHRWALGAIGLGSSNDFHKPFAPRAARHLAPVRLDALHARPRNVGRVEFLDERGALRRAHFLLNASVGIVAAANQLFNREEGFLSALKRRWTAAAIWTAALRVVLTAPDVSARLVVDGVETSTRITNAHILLSPHISGGLRYDLSIPPAGDAFTLALCEGLVRLARARVLLSLARGRFGGLAGTRILRAHRVEIHPQEPTPLETDGEVRPTTAIRISLVPGAVTVCA